MIAPTPLASQKVPEILHQSIADIDHCRSHCSLRELSAQIHRRGGSRKRCKAPPVPLRSESLESLTKPRAASPSSPLTQIRSPGPCPAPGQCMFWGCTKERDRSKNAPLRLRLPPMTTGSDLAGCLDDPLLALINFFRGKRSRDAETHDTIVRLSSHRSNVGNVDEEGLCDRFGEESSSRPGSGTSSTKQSVVTRRSLLPKDTTAQIIARPDHEAELSAFAFSISFERRANSASLSSSEGPSAILATPC